MYTSHSLDRDQAVQHHLSEPDRTYVMGRRPGKRMLYTRETRNGLWDSAACHEMGEIVANRLDCWLLIMPCHISS
jgi:hypothetical protein